VTQFQLLTLIIVLLPLLGSAIAGLWCRVIGTTSAHSVTISTVALSFLLSVYLCYQFVVLNTAPESFNLYTWGASGRFQFNIGFLLDHLSTIMLVVVNFVSLAVHIYSIGYMRGDLGYQRFFSYISLFTFMMLMLVSANNFLQLFFGWEGVGLVSYLLIGFWFSKDSANAGSLKAFIANRVGDFGFIVGIAVLFNYFGTLDYGTVFAAAPSFATQTMTIIPGHPWLIMSVICILLFVGAMGKSAQMPLHVWLPESMEGPTPISALIHAATMVTAGVYLVARMSPLFEYSHAALSVVLIIGATGALFTGLLAIVQNDIKRVIAYSTLSQLGYMVAALGVSAYAAGIFHLITHAFFKALLFLAAGSVILALHHEQDMRKMGNLWKYMPITYICFLIGALALAAIPPFAGFYSKDAIVNAIHLSTIVGAKYAYYCVLIGVFVTALYTFRAFFLVFHTQERMDAHTREHLRESPWVVWLPLVVLAIPSIISGFILADKMLYSPQSLLGSSILVLPQNNVLAKLAADYHGTFTLMIDAIYSIPFWLGIAGIVVAWWCYVISPKVPEFFARYFSWIYNMLVKKYGFDEFNQTILVGGSQKLAEEFYAVGDVKILDHHMVHGAGRYIYILSKALRKMQSGYLYHYAFAMIIGLLVLLAWLLLF
jgi:NADH-quinone oxidoreductase subunit L